MDGYISRDSVNKCLRHTTALRHIVWEALL